MISSTVFDKTRECNIISVPMSDHRGCGIAILLSEIVKGPGYWKFNNSLLEDIDYVNQMNEVIDSVVTDYNTANQDQQSWELLKLRIKQFSIRYSRQKNLERKNELLNLYNELNDLDVVLSASPSSAVTQAKREQVKLKIEMTEQHKARSVQVRARARWLKKEEKNTKYFLNLEKSRANVKIIDSLINDSGQLVTDQKDIMKMQRDYSANLYIKKISDVNMMDKINSFWGNTRTPHLSRGQTTGCKGPVLREEVLYALKQMKNDLLQELMESQ